MKVILLRDVAKLGKRFAVTEVSDGYALNKLIPQGMAEAATRENVKRVMARKDKLAGDAESEATSFATVCTALLSQTIAMAVDANDQGHLFKAVKGADIAEAMRQAGYTVPVESIILETPIKALGTYTVELKLGTTTGAGTLAVIKK